VNAKWAWINVTAEVTADFFEASQDRQSEMLASGQMPKDIRNYIDQMIDALRSR